MNKNKGKAPQQQDQGPTYEEVREAVLRDELKARHWKAQFETAYYFLEFEKVLPAYKELLDKKQQEEKELKEKMVTEIEAKIATFRAAQEEGKEEGLTGITEEKSAEGENGQINDALKGAELKAV